MAETTFLFDKRTVAGGWPQALDRGESEFHSIAGKSSGLIGWMTIQDRRVISATLGDGREAWAVTIEWGC